MGIISSVLLGSLMALIKDDFKYFFAYSAIANNGFLLVPLIHYSILSFFSLSYYLISYNILISIIFIPFLFLKKADNSILLSNLRNLIYLKKYNICVALCFISAIFSLAGVPPFIGFVAKLNILISAFLYASPFVIFCLLLFSLISTYYYIRLSQIIFFSSPLQFSSAKALNFTPSLLISLLTFLNFTPTLVSHLFFLSSSL